MVCLAILLGLGAAVPLAACAGPGEPGTPAKEVVETPAPAPAPDIPLPYVYTKWEQLTTAEGLPDNHVFAVRVFEDDVWIGTENGLARFDKNTGKIESWGEEEGLPWPYVVGAIDVDPNTGDVWLGLFGGGIARFSGGRFDHWHQLNSGLVNDVVYGLCIENDNVWVATTAGASRYNTKSGEWSIFTEKNAPMEEIWNYGAAYDDGLVYLAVWGSGILEYDIERGTWKDYLDPDGEMEIDLYRDDGIVHVITTGVSYVENVLWVTTYFGASRYDGRHWRGYYAHETGIPNDFHNAVRGRSADEAWFCTDQGIGALMDFESDTWVTYTTDQEAGMGKAVIQRGAEVLLELETDPNIPHNYTLGVDFDGDDVWIATSYGLAHGIGKGYYPNLRPAQR